MVVGNRDDPAGGKVTEASLVTNKRVTHVCPFVLDSIETDNFWIEASDETDLDVIEGILLAQIPQFMDCEPAHNPLHMGPPSGTTTLKTFLTFFPKYKLPNPAGPDIDVDAKYADMRIRFREAGLMLGQFYRGCRQGAVYNPEWKQVLTSPWLAFAIRYMAPHDKLFLGPDDPGYSVYTTLFPLKQ
jgi:hypothetical protein